MQDIHIREIVKYTNYKRFGAKSRIVFEGKELPKDQPPTQPAPGQQAAGQQAPQK
jgi:hypothetical protein